MSNAFKSISQPKTEQQTPFERPALYFGKKAQANKTSTLKRFILQQRDFWANKTQAITRKIEWAKANIKLFVSAAACLLTFFPIPDFCRIYIERYAFFGPLRRSALSTVQDKNLAIKMKAQSFHLADYKDKLKTAGFKTFDPIEDNVRLHGWYIPAKDDKPTVLFNYGRGSNASYFGHVMKMISDKGYGIFVCDYPGFGESEGEPSEDGCYKASYAATQYLKDTLKVPIEKQILLGYSLGSAVSSDTVQRLNKQGERPKAMALCSMVPSLQECMVDRLENGFPWLKNGFNPGYRLIKRLFKPEKIQLQLNASDKLKKTENVPLLILQGDKDTDTPLSLIKEKVLPRIPKSNQTKLIELKGTRHRLNKKDFATIGKHLFKFIEGLPPANSIPEQPA